MLTLKVTEQSSVVASVTMTAYEIYLPHLYLHIDCAYVLLDRARSANWRGRGKSTQSRRRVARVITEIFEKIYHMESL